MAENTHPRQVVVEDIDTQMHLHQPVYDTYGQKIGKVKNFDLTAGYMQVHRGGPEPKTWYVPFRLIATIDPRHIYLTVSEDTLITSYSVLPASQAVLKEWTNWRADHSETIVGHRMRSGYSGKPVVAFQQTYAALAGQLKAGMEVRDITGTFLGKLNQLDSRQGMMLVVKSGAEADVLVVPFIAIAYVDTAGYIVNLVEPKERLHGDLAALLPSHTTPAPPRTPAIGDTPQPQWSEPMRNETDENRERDDTVVVPIADWMRVGLPIYDVDGAKIGLVRRYSLEAGYMEVETGGLARKELYVPFHLMRSIDPREIYLTVSKDALTDTYLVPPVAKPLVQEQRDPSTGRSEVMLTHEMHSGYDGRPIQIAPVPLDDLTRRLSVGMTVLDVDDEYVGEVTQINTDYGLLTVKNSLARDVVRNIPFSVVARVDPDHAVVALLVPAIALEVER